MWYSCTTPPGVASVLALLAYTSHWPSTSRVQRPYFLQGEWLAHLRLLPCFEKSSSCCRHQLPPLQNQCRQKRSAVGIHSGRLPHCYDISSNKVRTQAPVAQCSEQDKKSLHLAAICGYFEIHTLVLVYLWHTGRLIAWPSLTISKEPAQLGRVCTALCQPLPQNGDRTQCVLTDLHSRKHARYCWADPCTAQGNIRHGVPHKAGGAATGIFMPAWQSTAALGDSYFRGVSCWSRTYAPSTWG